MSVVSIWRDNLSIGLFLCTHPYGAAMDDVLIYALGYNPNGTYPTNDRDRYEQRLREAQGVGNKKYHEREAGYFTISAQPFGVIWLYRAIWYIWTNPQSQVNQAVLVAETDMTPLKNRRQKDLNTREKNVRAIRTADTVQQQREALAAGDISRAYALQAQMPADDTFGELITNQLGLPYAEIAPVIDGIAQRAPFNSFHFNFTKTATKIRKLQSDLAGEQQHLVSQLSTWITIQTGLPPNARVLALQDAAQRYSQL